LYAFNAIYCRESSELLRSPLVPVYMAGCIDERLELGLARNVLAYIVPRRARQRRARRELLGAKYTGMRYKVHARASERAHAERASPIASPRSRKPPFEPVRE